MSSFLGQVIPELLKNETTISNVLSFTLNYSCDASTVDLRQLIELSPKNYYQSIDSRLTSFVDAAAATQQNQDQNDQTKLQNGCCGKSYQGKTP